MDIVDDDSTLDQPLLSPGDGILLLRAVQAHARPLAAVLGPRARLRPIPAAGIISSLVGLQQSDDRTRQTAAQILAFYGPLSRTVLPSSYASALGAVEVAVASPGHPLGVLAAVNALRDGKVNERVSGFTIGLGAAIELLGAALEEDAAAVLGKKKPADVARACARGCVHGALCGSLASMPPSIAGLVGGIAAGAQKALEIALEGA